MAATPRSSPYASVHEPQLTIDGREVLQPVPAPAPVAAPAEPLFAFEAFAQLSGQRALELEELEPRSVPCPRCGAGVGSPCRRPSGHTVFAGGIHAPRHRDAERAALGLEPYGAPDLCAVPAELESGPESAPQPVKRRSTSAADPEHRARMAAGAERARLERELRSCARVEAFRSWLRRGSPAREIPEVPRDADFATAREHGRDRAS
jgi:hypothetical protein